MPSSYNQMIIIDMTLTFAWNEKVSICTVEFISLASICELFGFELLSKHHFSKLDIHYRILKARASLPKKWRMSGQFNASFQVFVIIQHQHPKKTPVTAKKNRFMMILYSSAPEPHINIFWILHAIKKWQMNAKRVTILNCCVGVYFSISSNLLSRSWKKYYKKIVLGIFVV